MKQRKLSAQESNRLAVQMQALRIELIQFALRFTFAGKSYLWGQEVDDNTVERERSKLAELYRIKEIYGTIAYRKLKYVSTAGAKVGKIKEHYDAKDGTISFVEIKEGSRGQSVTNFLNSKGTIKRRIRKKQLSSNRKLKQMATKKRATKPKAEDDDLMAGIVDVSAIDDMLAGIELDIPAYKPGDKLRFNHKGVQKDGSVLKSMSEGKLKVVDAAANVYHIEPEDILFEGEPEEITRARVTSSDVKPVAGKKGKNTTPPTRNESVPKGVRKPEATAPPKTKAKKGEKTQRELVEELAEKGIMDYDKIAEKTGVTRSNVSQYMYRWKKANPKKVK